MRVGIVLVVVIVAVILGASTVGYWYYGSRPAQPQEFGADFTWEANFLTVRFVPTPQDPDPPLRYSYQWDFGDSGNGTSWGELEPINRTIIQVHRYDRPGTYRVVLTVQDLPRYATVAKNVTVPPQEPVACPNSVGLCFSTTVSGVVDGDTVEIEDGYLKVRLVLVDAPELYESGGAEARGYLQTLCLGSPALIDEDDWQIGADPHGRILAVVYCGGTNANAVMISSGHADTYYLFCSESEFGSEAWTGCSSPPPTPPTAPAPAVERTARNITSSEATRHPTLPAPYGMDLRSP